MDLSTFPAKWLEDFVTAIKYIKEGLTRAQKDLDIAGSAHSSFDVVSLFDNNPGILARLRGVSEYCMSHSVTIRKEIPWKWCLESFNSSECSDSRDMYYTLVSMAFPRMSIDYSLTTAAVFQNFAENMLAHGHWRWVF